MNCSPSLTSTTQHGLGPRHQAAQKMRVVGLERGYEARRVERNTQNVREGFYFSGLLNEVIERVSNIMTTATPTDRPIRGGTQDQKKPRQDYLTRLKSNSFLFIEYLFQCCVPPI